MTPAFAAGGDIVGNLWPRAEGAQRNHTTMGACGARPELAPWQQHAGGRRPAPSADIAAAEKAIKKEWASAAKAKKESELAALGDAQLTNDWRSKAEETLTKEFRAAIEARVRDRRPLCARRWGRSRRGVALAGGATRRSMPPLTRLTRPLQPLPPRAREPDRLRSGG